MTEQTTQTRGRKRITEEYQRRNKVVISLTDAELMTVKRLAELTHLSLPAMIVHSAFRTMRLHYPDVMPEILEETKMNITFAAQQVTPCIPE